MSHRIPFLGLLLGLVTSAGQAQVVFTPIRYELALEVDYEAQQLRGTARIMLENPSSEPVRQVSLLLYRLLSVGAVRNERGGDLPFTQTVVAFEDFGQLQINQILVTLPAPLPPGQRTVLGIDYAGYLLGYAETGMAYVKDHIDPDFTILRDDAFAFPLPGIPSVAARRRAPEPAYSYSASITVPKGLTVVNGGRLEGIDTAGNSVTFRYSNQRPAWRMDFAIGKYGQLSAGALRVFHLPGDEAGGAGVAKVGQEAIELFTAWFGPPISSTALTFIEIPDGWGSQADGPTVIQTAAAFHDPARYREVYHEISHLWNVSSTDRPSPRWEEGLASFLEDLMADTISGRATVDDRATRVMKWLRDQLPAHANWENTPLVDYGRTGLTDLSYSVGALFFDLLFRMTGQNTFNQIIGSYTARFGASGGNTEDFVQVINQSSTRDLSLLVNDWLYTTGWTARVRQYPDIQALAAFYRGGPPR